MVAAWNRGRERTVPKDESLEGDEDGEQRPDEDGKVRLTRPPERDRIEPRADSAVGVVTCRGSYTLRLPACLPCLARSPARLAALPALPALPGCLTHCPCERDCVRTALRRGVARRVSDGSLCRGDASLCASPCVDGGPGPALGPFRPVPSRPVEYRTALATRYPQQFQPAARLPVSHRTPNRLHSEAIREPFSPSTSPFSERETRGARASSLARSLARTRALFHPGESRIAYIPATLHTPGL